MRYTSQHKYKRFLERDGHFSVEREGLFEYELWKADLYHYICNLSWTSLIVTTIFYFLILNAVFASLYWVDMKSLGGTGPNGSWLDGFFFSVQTMTTIGYGFYHPEGLYLNSIVCVEAWITFITNAIYTGIVITKIQRPSRLRHTVDFSKCAVINSETPCFHYDNQDWNPTGEYRKGTPVFSFRIFNLRKRLLCMPDLRLLLLKKEGKDYVMYELDYEINRQIGRPRIDTMSKPHLQLPWTVFHKIDENSPLYGKTKRDMEISEFEIICVLDGVDELTSLNFQCRWSYIPSEIKWDFVFADMIYRNPEGTLCVDCKKLSEIEPVRQSRDDTGIESSMSFIADNDESSPLVKVENW